MTQKSSNIPNFDAVKNENNTWFPSVLPCMCIVVYGRQATMHDSKYGTTRVLFASTYTAKQMETMNYSLIIYRQP